MGGKRKAAAAGKGGSKRKAAVPRETAAEPQRDAVQEEPEASASGTALFLSSGWLDGVIRTDEELLTRARSADLVVRMPRKMRISEVYMRRLLRANRAFQRREKLLREAWQTQVERVTGEADEWRKTSVTMQENNKGLQANFSELQKFCTKLQDGHSKLAADHDSLQKDFALLQNHNVSLLAQVEREQQARERVEAELEDSRRVAEDFDEEGEEPAPEQVHDEGAGPAGRSRRSRARSTSGAPAWSAAAASEKSSRGARSRPKARASTPSRGGGRAPPQPPPPTHAHVATPYEEEEQLLTDPEDLAMDPPRPMAIAMAERGAEAAFLSARALSGGQSPIVEFQGAPIGKGTKVPTDFFKFPPSEPQRPITRSSKRRGSF